MDIGIEKDHDLVYEGKRPYGRAIWPAPIITPAKITYESDGEVFAERSGENIFESARFREDHFDPISRIRRGRFYFGDGVGSQPVEWYVQPHPALAYERDKTDVHGLQKSLYTFTSRSIWHKFVSHSEERPLVILGLDNRFTLWTIINIEVISTGEDLVTLRARSSLGVLPKLIDDKIPETYQSRITESLEAFVNEVRRASPISVIDRARDAASQIALAHYEASGSKARDLGELANKLENDKMIIAASAAKIIARLHARAKPVETAKRPLRSIREQDAELATQCVGVLLCELGWADWH